LLAILILTVAVSPGSANSVETMRAVLLSPGCTSGGKI